MENNQILDEIKSLLLEVAKKVERQEEKIKALESKIIAIDQNKISEKNDGGAPAGSALSSPQIEAGFKKEEINFVESHKGADKENFEERLGGKWFAKIGIAALFIGVSLFLKYAFDNNWINEAGRVAIGISAGCGLLVTGGILIKKYFNYGQVLFGGGIAVLYLSIFAAFDFYHLIPAYAAFIAMFAVTAAAMFLSLRYDAVSLIMVAIAGGFFTPVLCSSGVNNQIGLFSYLLILDLAIFLAALFKKWRQLNLLGFIGTVFLSWLWYEQFYTIKQLPATIFFLTLFFFIYSIVPLVSSLFKKEISAEADQIVTLFAGMVYFGSVYGLMDAKYHAWMGAFALILGFYYLIWAYLLKSVFPQDENLYNFLAFLSAGFAAIAIPIQFKYYAITIGWMIEALLLLYIGSNQEKGMVISDNKGKKQNAAIALGSVVAFLAVLRLLIFDSTRIAQNEVLLVNKRFGVFLFVILCFYIAGYFFNECICSQVSQERANNLKNIMVVMLIAANLLTIFALSKETINYHNREISALRIEQNKIYDSWQYKNNGSGAYSDANYQKLKKKIDNVNYRSSIVLSLLWLIYAIILLIIGFAGSHKEIRIGGIALLILAMLKLFFYDLWRLGTLYRIISSMSMGVVLLLISFAYQKYKEKLKKIM